MASQRWRIPRCREPRSEAAANELPLPPDSPPVPPDVRSRKEKRNERKQERVRSGKPMPQAEEQAQRKIAVLQWRLEEEHARRQRAEADAARQRSAAQQAEQQLLAAQSERKEAEAARQAAFGLRQELFRCNRHAISAAAQAVNAVKDASQAVCKTRDAVLDVGLAAAIQRDGRAQLRTSVSQAAVGLFQKAGLMQSETQHVPAAEPVHACVCVCVMCAAGA